MQQTDGENVLFEFQAIYGFHTRKPMVEIIINGKSIAKIEANDAVALATHLITVAGMSIGDAFMFEFGKEIMQGDEAEAAGIVGAFRAWRQANKIDDDRTTKTERGKKGRKS